ETLNADIFTSEPGETVDESGVFFRFALERSRERRRIEPIQHLVKLEAGEIDGGRLEFGRIGLQGDLCGVFELEFQFVETVAVLQPVLVAALPPVSEVHGYDAG